MRRSGSANRRRVPFGDPAEVCALHSDYAFIIGTSLVKSLPIGGFTEQEVIQSEWDFNLHPNPARHEIIVTMPNEDPASILILDPSGRILNTISHATGPRLRIQLDFLAKGVYYVCATQGPEQKTKKLIIH